MYHTGFLALLFLVVTSHIITIPRQMAHASRAVDSMLDRIHNDIVVRRRVRQAAVIMVGTITVSPAIYIVLEVVRSGTVA